MAMALAATTLFRCGGYPSFKPNVPAGTKRPPKKAAGAAVTGNGVLVINRGSWYVRALSHRSVERLNVLWAQIHYLINVA